MVTENKPLVTIGIPVFNGGKYILDTLESIKNQTYTTFECFIVNNASSDNTERIVKEFIKKDSRFSLHSYNEFVDIVVNWNRTVKYITDKTRYFQIVAADDIIFPDYLESSVQLMEKYPGAGIATAFRMVGDSPNGYGLDYTKGNYWNGKEILLKHLKNEVNVVGSVTQNLYRVEYLKKLTFFPQVYISEDLHFDVRLAFEVLLISDLAFSFKITSYTRVHPDTVTSTIAKRFFTPIQGRENRLHRFKQHFPELQKDYTKIRRTYAYLLFVNTLILNKKCIHWHRKKLKRKIKFPEYVKGVFLENKVSRFIFLLINRYVIRSANKPMGG